MDEILPGVLQWTTRHPDIGIDVASHLVTGPGVAIDPLLPEGEGPDWLGHDVGHVVVTICLHTRSTTDFGVPVRAPREGLHRWEGRGIDVAPYADGDEVAPGVRALRIGAIAPDDYALHIDTGPGILAFGDAIIRYGDIGFVPDHLIGDDPEAVKRETIDALERLLDEEFDALLFAHGEPLASGGKAALREFVERGGSA
jgi:glyoxylase-like metal-dependent hydrolase (beta-lactamase superfamily II)